MNIDHSIVSFETCGIENKWFRDYLSDFIPITTGLSHGSLRGPLLLISYVNLKILQLICMLMTLNFKLDLTSSML